MTNDQSSRDGHYDYSLEIILIILGIDPGTHAAGYALLKKDRVAMILLSAGLIPIRGTRQDERLVSLHQELGALIKKWRPRVLAIERLFFTKNQKTAFSVAEARGVTLLTGALAGLMVFEYTPLEIKKTVTGFGGADKMQVKKMVHLTLPETRSFKQPDDVFDAIAVALTFCYKEKINQPLPGTIRSEN